jgi:hypothetical protein
MPAGNSLPYRVGRPTFLSSQEPVHRSMSFLNWILFAPVLQLCLHAHPVTVLSTRSLLPRFFSATLTQRSGPVVTGW